MVNITVTLNSKLCRIQMANLFCITVIVASSRQGDGSYKGSVVYGPDGEAISVGGAVGLPDSPVPVLDINKLLDGAGKHVLNR